MKKRKPDVDKKEDKKGMPRKEQVAIPRLRTGYTRAPTAPRWKGSAIHYALDYAKEIGLYNGIHEWKKQPKSIKDHSKEEEVQPRWR
jgi:hypothetical protein